MLKLIKHEFIYGGHLLSLGAGAIVAAVSLLLDYPFSPMLFFIAYLVSQLVYNFDHLSDVFIDSLHNLERTKHLKKTKNIQLLLFCFYLVLFMWTFMYINKTLINLASFIVLGGFAYTLKAKKITKKITGFKNIYIAFFWSILAFFVPVYFRSNSFSWSFFAIFTYIFIRWIINSVFFDIKDYAEDKHKKLKTIPVVFGMKDTIFYLHILNIASGLLILFAVFFNILPFYSSTLTLFPLYSFYYLRIATKVDDKKLRLVSYIMVDGEYLFWPLVLYLSKLIFNIY